LSLVFILTALHEPLLGPPVTVVAVIALLLVSAIGVGLLVAVVSDSERMAIQASLLLLLASIFFSGFVIDLELFSEPVRVLGSLLPVTHAIVQLQDVMLFGAVRDGNPILALGAIGAVSIVAGWFLLRRSMGARA
jgi:ABC-2 type transport system permease protein